MKQVFTNSELAHIWASQHQTNGRNANDSFYFRGKSIYSYGSHFEIARILNFNTVLFTVNSYSNTTAKHVNCAHYAVNHKQLIYMSDFDSPKDSIKYWIEQINVLSEKHIRARKYDYTNEIEHAKTQINLISDNFKIRLLKSQKDVLNAEISEVGERVQKLAKKETEAQKRKELKRIRTFTGDKTTKRNKTNVYLTIQGEIVKTSRGANVPVKEGKILFDRIQKGKDIKGFEIGYYTVISINGTLKIGCHEITRHEIERFTKFYNW